MKKSEVEKVEILIDRLLREKVISGQEGDVILSLRDEIERLMDIVEEAIGRLSNAVDVVEFRDLISRKKEPVQQFPTQRLVDPENPGARG